MSTSQTSSEELRTWLYADVYSLNEKLRKSFSPSIKSEVKLESEKIFDSRTFTRPKKRYSRPSIEKYNEELYGSQNEHSIPAGTPQSLSDTFDLKRIDHDTVKEEQNVRPLSFDLNQQTSSFYFDNILANASDIDSFQNMSPPSLVNSMCSSTFTNLMENSYIKNDPLLREIRDTDFTETILLQDAVEPTLIQSFTESCSSLNSDTPENFLRKLSLNASFKKSLLKDLDDYGCEMQNDTYTVDNVSDPEELQGKFFTCTLHTA